MTEFFNPSIRSGSIEGGKAKDFDPNIQIPLNLSGGGDIQADKQAINKALSAFERVAAKAAQRATQELVQEARYNPSIRDAINTKEIQHNTMPNVMGVQRNNYGVFAIPSEGKTRYEVVSLSEQKKVIGDLRLHDSAEAIVKLLNRNYSFYSPEVAAVLQLEATYTKHYNDAVSFQRKSGDKAKDSIREDRFNEAKHKFLTVKEQLIDFNKKLS